MKSHSKIVGGALAVMLMPVTHDVQAQKYLKSL
jgi:hypothetical protein